MCKSSIKRINSIKHFKLKQPNNLNYSEDVLTAMIYMSNLLFWADIPGAVQLKILLTLSTIVAITTENVVSQRCHLFSKFEKFSEKKNISTFLTHSPDTDMY